MRPSINVGQAARQDPIVAFASVWASSLLLQASSVPPSRRLKWLRGELNKTHPGMGDEFVTKMRTLRRQGATPDQSAFDALRLMAANRVAKTTEKFSDSGLSGLGATKGEKARKGMCAIAGIAGAGGQIAASFGDNPSASPVIADATTNALSAMGCGQEALETQLEIAKENTAAAQANAAAAAAAAGDEEDDKTMTYVAIGGGVLLVGLLGVVALKK